jgi:predicted nucleic acid-binding protein
MLVLDELIYVSRRKYGIPCDIAIEFIKLNVLPYVYVIGLGEEEYKQATKFLLDYNLKPSDALHLGAMVSNGINTIVSEDSEFDRVPIVKRLWI